MRIANALLIVLLLVSSAWAFGDSCPEQQFGDVRLYVSSYKGQDIYKVDMCQWESTTGSFDGSQKKTFSWQEKLEPTINKDKAIKKYRLWKRAWRTELPLVDEDDEKKAAYEKLKWRRIE